MKKILVMVLALVMAISMLACASAAELKWASAHPPEQVVTQMMMRAIDEINVQVMMEELGGGGHMNIAGAQVQGTVEEARDMLKQIIDHFLEKNHL